MADPSPFRTVQWLDGPWEFRFGDDPAWRAVSVPNPWQASCPDLRDRFGLGRYRRRVTLPDTMDMVVLRFGAASEIATVRLDGRELGRHEGGYLPFEIVVPPEAPRDALLEVDTLQPSLDEATYPDRPFPEYPHGKQSWYGPLGGLWQSVMVETRPLSHIAHVAVRAGMDGVAFVTIEVAQVPRNGIVRVALLDRHGAAVTHAQGALREGGTSLSLAAQSPDLWSPDDPVLYSLEVTLEGEGRALDRVTETFGFRSIEALDGKLLLNGKPLYLRGALDQDYYPDGICTPPSTAFLEDQIRKAKALGLNCLRCHMKVPDPRYHAVADRLGMLIWTEIPNVAQFTARSAARLRDTFAGILRRDGNHPSIICWTIINEDWGTRLVEDADHRAWLAETYDWVKALDPTRLVVDNSPCLPNFHVKTDIDDYHYYRGIPERRAEWDALTADFANRPDWSFTPHGDGQRTGREPMVVSEFGVWGLPHPRTMHAADGAEPAWMESGPFWGDGAAYPHGVESRAAALSLDRAFGSFDGFIDAAQWHQFQGLKYQIESMRAQASIMGYVITEFTDVHWEANGLLDLARNPRVFHDRFASVNADVVLLPRLERWAFWEGETVSVPLRVATGGAKIPAGAMLEWRFAGQGGQVPVPAMPPTVVEQVTILDLDIPATTMSERIPLSLTLRDPSGAILASNTEPLACYPRSAAPPERVASPDPVLRAYLAALGYAVVAPEIADVLVTRDLDAADVEAIRQGRHVLVLADGHTPKRPSLRADELPREPPFLPVVDARPGLPAATHHFFPGLGLVERHGTLWRGDWIGNFSWLRRTGAFAALPGGPMLDLGFDRVVPHHVLTGLQPWEWETRVQAGVVVGWAHKPAATLCERPFGAGRLVATTFRLMEDPAGQDPVAATLMRAIIETAASPSHAARTASEPSGKE
ncbi:glycoside hydrolase family 2 TIM barrel-domain containing protein [Lichenihabitans sp. Uapishka_5]|uniref:glycoside hydrolase family 2 protein n=1 Tax=Lichenihabitans sp. Uapishka_5 TaxID=3037302 RepID=UPI0029E81D89|nr:glycoside hydrolase family 2 TIM barrel-domain containing protein [Lichenihabitans sp. Uapishka_5]MDX7951176.1 glycoside hydrolase family 2 TIM barrel-domain containing protein [Lichenihabitans sp. Uapishka_5]